MIVERWESNIWFEHDNFLNAFSDSHEIHVLVLREGTAHIHYKE